MKKKINWFVYLGLAVLVLTLAAFLFPIAPGLTRTIEGSATVEWFSGYDYVFGNNANHIISTGGFIGAFALLIIAAVFELMAFVFSIPNPESAHKFSGFMYIVSGICVAVAGALFLFAKGLAIPAAQPTASNVTYHLGYGFLVGGAAGVASGVISIVIGLMAMMKKSKNN